MSNDTEHPAPVRVSDPDLHSLVTRLLDASRHSPYAPGWSATIVQLKAGTSKQIVSANERRAILRMWTDGSNTTPVFISPRSINYTPGASAGAVALAGNMSDPLPLEAPGEVHAYSDADALLHVIEIYSR